jgi:hypothetical protein
MKALSGSGVAGPLNRGTLALILALVTERRRVFSLTPRPLYHQENSSSDLFTKRVGDSPFWRRKSFSPLPGFQIK